MSFANQPKEPCLLPWVHMYYFTDKKVYPCCKLIGNPKYEIGNTNDSSVQLWNSDVMKTLRKRIVSGTEPQECVDHCYDNINPLHVHLPQDIKSRWKEFFNKTSVDGSYEYDFTIWNINESNVCNFACVYCCSDFSNRFDNNTIKSFSSIEEMLNVFKENVHNIKTIYLSSGETHLQTGYYKLLEFLIESKLTHIEIIAHTNMSGYTFGNKNLFELLNQFENSSVFASLDSYGERAEYIRVGTKWKDIEDTRTKLFEYPRIKFAIQPVITNMNIWSLPDFHIDWVNRGFVDKGSIRYFPLNSPEELNVTVMSNKMKHKVREKYSQYLEFLKQETDTTLNNMTPRDKILQILDYMDSDPITSFGKFEYFILKQNIKNKSSFKRIFPEFE